MKKLFIMSLLLALCKGVFFMEANAAEAYKPFVVSVLKHDAKASLYPEQKNFQKLYNATSFNAVYPDSRYGIVSNKKGSIAVIPVQGAIMKQDYCGAYGTQTIATFLQQAENNPNITGSVLIIDSPGGSADGTGNLSDLIYGLKKPVVAYVDGMAASAAYWIASSADHIMASYKTDLIGSIGTYLTLHDFKGYLEQNGIVEHNIYADKSINKNADTKDALAGNYDPIKQNLINPFNESFLSGVRKNRYGKNLSKEVFTGTLYIAEAAKSVNLIDSIGSFDQALNLVKQLA